MPAQGMLCTSRRGERYSPSPHSSARPAPPAGVGLFMSQGFVAGYRPPAAGKISTGAFRRIIRPHLGARSTAVLVGPENGVDAGIVDLGDGRVMALTTDPFFVLPQYGWERAAWFAVHIIASDACTSGLRPAYLTVDLNLPPEMPDDDLEALWLA